MANEQDISVKITLTEMAAMQTLNEMIAIQINSAGDAELEKISGALSVLADTSIPELTTAVNSVTRAIQSVEAIIAACCCSCAGEGNGGGEKQEGADFWKDEGIELMKKGVKMLIVAGAEVLVAVGEAIIAGTAIVIASEVIAAAIAGAIVIAIGAEIYYLATRSEDEGNTPAVQQQMQNGNWNGTIGPDQVIIPSGSTLATNGGLHSGQHWMGGIGPVGATGAEEQLGNGEGRGLDRPVYSGPQNLTVDNLGTNDGIKSSGAPIPDRSIHGNFMISGGGLNDGIKNSGINFQEQKSVIILPGNHEYNRSGDSTNTGPSDSTGRNINQIDTSRTIKLPSPPNFTGGKPTSIYIDSLIKQLTIHTNSITEVPDKIREHIAQALLDAVNDFSAGNLT